MSAKVIAFTDGGCVPNPGVGGWGVVDEVTLDWRWERAIGQALGTSGRMGWEWTA